MTEAKLTKRGKLLKKLEQTKNELKQLDARDKAQKRKIENRTKIIIGGTVLTHMGYDAEFEKQIMALVNRYGRKQDKDYLKRHQLISGFNLASANTGQITVKPMPASNKELSANP